MHEKFRSKRHVPTEVTDRPNISTENQREGAASRPWQEERQLDEADNRR
ncbi:MAG: hypothetical protein J7494_08285 [Sphingobium sp.]|nr:hypothetical protein [Sphingobium sp.]